MRAFQKVGVSTTSSLDGWEIEEYLGPVVAHTVAGTNILSDFFASVSDIFGGRSYTYQRQLRSLSDEAITALRERAYNRGANWIVGMTVDMDEVSGHGKQMFMVTAMGTAVRATRRPTAPSSAAAAGSAAVSRANGAPGASGVSNEVVQAAARRYAFIENLRAGKLVFDGTSWAMLADERIVEGVPDVLVTLGRLFETDGYLNGVHMDPAQFRQRAAAYLDRLGEEAAPALYAALERSPHEATAAIALITDLKLRDLAAIRTLLAAPTFELRRRAVQVIPAEQRSYLPTDIEQLEVIAAICADETVFPRITTFVAGSGKGFFGGKDRLVCQCGTERAATVAICPNSECRRDQWGFRSGDVTLAAARDKALADAALLRRVFEDVAGHPSPSLSS